MLQLRKKILAGLLCSAVVLSASQSVAWSETAEVPTEAGTVESADTAEEAEDAASDVKDTAVEVAPITEEQALAECKLYAETSTLELYVNEGTGYFAV